MNNEKLKQQVISYALLVLGSALFAIGEEWDADQLRPILRLLTDL